MEREILFKAKRLDNGEWVEGSLLQTTAVSLKSFIVPSACYTFGKWDWIGITEVDSDTICQYTELDDEFGNKIWENDIVTFEDTGEDGYEYKEGFEFQNRAKVVFEKGRWELSNFLSDNSYVLENMNNHEELFALWDYVEVTGNIFDNAYLLEESND